MKKQKYDGLIDLAEVEAMAKMRKKTGCVCLDVKGPKSKAEYELLLELMQHSLPCQAFVDYRGKAYLMFFPKSKNKKKKSR